MGHRRRGGGRGEGRPRIDGGRNRWVFKSVGRNSRWRGSGQPGALELLGPHTKGFKELRGEIEDEEGEVTIFFN